MQKSPAKSNRAVKICSRGHHYRGNQCPVCWPGGVKRGVVKATAVKRKRPGKRTQETVPH